MTHQLGKLPYLPRPPAQRDVESIHKFEHDLTRALHANLRDILFHLDGMVIGTTLQAWDANLDQIAALSPADGTFLVGDGSSWVAESGATARASLGLTIGTHVQAWDADLDTIAALAKADGNIIVGDGAAWVAESGATARASLGAVGTADANVFTALQTFSTTAADTAVVELLCTEDSATLGPVLNLKRDSASPAANDALGRVRFVGKSSTGVDRGYGAMRVAIIDPTNASEDGEYIFTTLVGGAFVDSLRIGDGVKIGAPTGGYQGAGTLNATAVYDDNVILTDYVFDKWSGDPGDYYSPRMQARYDTLDPRMFDIDAYAAFFTDNHHLYGMPDANDAVDGAVKGQSLGGMIHLLWQTAELNAIHVAGLNARIRALEENSNAPNSRH